MHDHDFTLEQLVLASWSGKGIRRGVFFPIKKKSKKSKDNYGREGSIKKGRSVAALEKKTEKMSIKAVC